MKTISLNASREDSLNLGWNAMPAFGSAFGSAFNSGLSSDDVADFVMQARHLAPAKSELSSSFWSSLTSPMSTRDLALA